MKINYPSNIFIAGKSNSGKTHLLEYLVMQGMEQGRFDYGFAVCTTVSAGNYKWMGEYAYSTFDEQKVANIMRLQIANEKPPCFLIFDDVLGCPFLTKRWMKQFMTTARHYNISIFILSQGVTDIPNTIREQCHYHCVFKQSTTLSVDNAYETSANGLVDKKDFHNINNNLPKYSFIFGGSWVKRMKVLKIPKKYRKYNIIQ